MILIESIYIFIMAIGIAMVLWSRSAATSQTVCSVINITACDISVQ